MPNICSSTQSLPAEMVPKGGLANRLKSSRKSVPQSFFCCLEDKEIKRIGGQAQLPFGLVVPCGISASLTGNIHTLFVLFDFVFAQIISSDFHCVFIPSIRGAAL